MASNIRSPFAVAYETWKALFLRETISRLSVGRAAVWILVDPIVHLTIMLIMFSVIRMRSVGGIDTSLWILVGILSYDTFRDTMASGRNIVKPNQILLTYRQIKPLDIIVVKALVEFLLTILIAIILFTALALFGKDVLPADPLAVLVAVFALWLIGFGMTLMLSVLEHIVPDTAKITNLVTAPLYMCSGVIIPLTILPANFRDWLMLNPLLHAVEAARAGFSPYYHAMPGISMGYAYVFALVFVFFGLALQWRFRNRLMVE